LRWNERDVIPLTGDTSLHFFLERSGILREPLKGKLDFAHRTFQEFMAANAAIAEGDVGVLLSNASKAQWREVVVLGAGLARHAERADLIRSLIRTGDEDKSIRPHFYLLAVACLDAAVDVDNALRSEVEKRIRSLFPPINISNAMQIAEAAGEMAVPYLKRKGYLNSKQSIACIRALAMIGTREAIAALAGHATGSTGSVIREVVRASDRIDPEMYLEVVVPQLNPRDLPGSAIAQLIEKFGFDRMPALQLANELSIAGTGTRNLGYLRRFARLETLRLSGRGVEDLTPLVVLRDLKRLVLDRVPLIDPSPLKGLPLLSDLYFSRCSVDAQQIAEIARTEVLRFSMVDIKNPEALSRLPDLRNLAVFQSNVDFAFLKGVKQITRLSLSYFYADTSLLASLDNLEDLTVIVGNVGDLRWLSALKKLKTIDLFRVTIDESAKFPKLPSLQKVSIAGMDRDTSLAKQVYKNYPQARITPLMRT
jgi:hypothetical protein